MTEKTDFFLRKVSLIVNKLFCGVIAFNNPIKACFLNKKYTVTIYVEGVWILTGYFLLKKQALIGLLKAITPQNSLFTIKLTFLKKNSVFSVIQTNGSVSFIYVIYPVSPNKRNSRIEQV